MPHSTSERLDTAFDALTDGHRRRVLFTLLLNGPQGENAFGIDSFVPRRSGDEDPETVRVELYHAHLPKLAESGYVDWDPDAETVRRGPKFDDVAPLLELLVTHDERLPVDSS